MSVLQTIPMFGRLLYEKYQLRLTISDRTVHAAAQPYCEETAEKFSPALKREGAIPTDLCPNKKPRFRVVFNGAPNKRPTIQLAF